MDHLENGSQVYYTHLHHMLHTPQRHLLQNWCFSHFCQLLAPRFFLGLSSAGMFICIRFSHISVFWTGYPRCGDWHHFQFPVKVRFWEPGWQSRVAAPYFPVLLQVEGGTGRKKPPSELSMNDRPRCETLDFLYLCSLSWIISGIKFIHN